MNAILIFENSRVNVQHSDSLNESLEDVGINCSKHKILDSGRVFPELPSENPDVVIYLGFDENRIPKHNSIVFSIFSSNEKQNRNLNYRFKFSLHQFLMQNVSDLPLNAEYSAHDLMSVACLISKIMRDKRSMVDAIFSR